MVNSSIVICIPGKWMNLEEIKNGFANNLEYDLRENVIVSKNNDEFYKIIFENRDDEMAEAFQFAGTSKISQEDISEINQHTSVVYLVGEAGNLEKVHQIIKLTNTVLMLGGLGVKIETTGNAVGCTWWRHLNDKMDPMEIWNTFVTTVEEQDYY
ncbi:hypothetical protein [Paenibacillus sp. Z6-24]